MTTPFVVTVLPTIGDRMPVPWISAIVATVGSGSGSGPGPPPVWPVFAAPGVGVAVNSKSVALLSVSTKFFRDSEPGVELLPV